MVVAVPFHKTPKTRTRNRRSHWKLQKPLLIPCSHCGELVVPHRVCPSCGYYKDRKIVEV